MAFKVTLTFEWNMVTSDYAKYVSWMRGHSGGAACSWLIWRNEENTNDKKVPFTSKIWLIIKSVLYLIIAEGIAWSNFLRADTTLN